jgi:hypothetical protein
VEPHSVAGRIGEGEMHCFFGGFCSGALVKKNFVFCGLQNAEEVHFTFVVLQLYLG